MDTPIETQAQPACKYPQASTRKHVVNGRYAALLAEDFGIEWGVVLEALVGEPQRQAIAICDWAEKTKEPAKALVCWARKNKRGTYRPDANNAPARPGVSAPRRSEGDSLRGILVNPERLAETANKLGV